MADRSVKLQFSPELCGVKWWVFGLGVDVVSLSNVKAAFSLPLSNYPDIWAVKLVLTFLLCFMFL